MGYSQPRTLSPRPAACRHLSSRTPPLNHARMLPPVVFFVPSTGGLNPDAPKGGESVLKVSSVSKSYDSEPVLRDVSFVLNDGERLGLVGPNGSGKSTLLKLLGGQLQTDSGSVWLPPSETVAYLPQYPRDELHLSVRDSLLLGAGNAGELERRIAELEKMMAGASGTELDQLLVEYGRAREEWERLGGYELDARLEEVTRGLALDAATLDMPVAALSGGNKTKLSLARLLLSNASVLLLDEPTNYLDLPSLLWLERFVTDGARSYLIVSHDRRFLDRTVTGILELDPVTHSLREWPGNYTEYVEAKEAEEARQLERYLDQQAEKRRVEEDIRRTREQARSTEAATKLDTTRRYAKKVAKKAKARERRLERQLEESSVEKPHRSWGLHLTDLGKEPITDDRTVLTISRLAASYGGRDILHDASLELRGRDRLALLGPNGSGKSTLLRCVAGKLPHQGTVRLGNVRPGYMSQEAEDLPSDQVVLDVFRSQTRMYEDEVRTYLHKFLFGGEEVHKRVGQLSYGQRAKLALALLVLGDANFLILDEPTSHLDMPALEAVEEALAAYTGPMLVVSHDRYFLDRIRVNRVEVMENGRLRPVEGVEQYEEEVVRNDAG